MSKRLGVLTSIHLLCLVSFAQKFLLFGSLAHRLSKHLVASQYVGNGPRKVCQNHGSSLQGPEPISILQGQHVNLLVVDAGDGGAEVVGAEGLDGHLLDDLPELRGGHLDLVHLAGAPRCCTCTRWAGGRPPGGGRCRRPGGCTPGERCTRWGRGGRPRAWSCRAPRSRGSSCSRSSGARARRP